MAKTKGGTKINIRPYHSNIRRYEGGFEWQFISQLGYSGGRRKIINIKFDRWWLVYLAKDIQKVLEEEQSELNRLIELCGFKEKEK